MISSLSFSTIYLKISPMKRNTLSKLKTKLLQHTIKLFKLTIQLSNHCPKPSQVWKLTLLNSTPAFKLNTESLLPLKPRETETNKLLTTLLKCAMPSKLNSTTLLLLETKNSVSLANLNHLLENKKKSLETTVLMVSMLSVNTRNHSLKPELTQELTSYNSPLRSTTLVKTLNQFPQNVNHAENHSSKRNSDSDHSMIE